jgi:hypothetical protein
MATASVAVRDPAPGRWASCDRFFFAVEQPYALALIRLLLPWVLYIAVLHRWWYVRELYSLDGAPAPFWECYGAGALPIVFGPSVAVALFTLLIFALFTMSIGWQTRASICIVLVLYPYFGLLDSLSTLTKYTVIATHVLLLLACSRCGDVWSVDAWLAGRSGESLPEPSPRWTRRMLQILIAVVYFGAAATKLHQPVYFSGDLMRFWMLTRSNFPNPVGQALSVYPALIVAMSYLGLFWEITFIFLCWKRPARDWMLRIGLLFHAMTFLLLGLILFPLLFMVLYIAFLEEDEARRLGERLSPLYWWRWFNRTSVMPGSQTGPRDGSQPALSFGLNLATFAGIAALVSLLGVSAEARLDPYGHTRHPERLVLQPMSPEREAEVFSQPLPIRLADKVFDFEVGSILVGHQLADSRRQFRHGEQLIAHCMLTPPHEDLWLEINLHDAHNHPVDRFGTVIPREELHVNATFTLSDALPPGPYDVVLRLHGREVFRRAIVLQ